MVRQSLAVSTTSSTRRRCRASSFADILASRRVQPACPSVYEAYSSTSVACWMTRLSSGSASEIRIAPCRTLTRVPEPESSDIRSAEALSAWVFILLSFADLRLTGRQVSINGSALHGFRHYLVRGVPYRHADSPGPDLIGSRGCLTAIPVLGQVPPPLSHVIQLCGQLLACTSLPHHVGQRSQKSRSRPRCHPTGVLSPSHRLHTWGGP